MKLLVITLLIAAASADVSHILSKGGEENAKILSQSSDIGLEGQYRFNYETENGITGSEQGGLKSVPGAEVPAEVVQGQARWTAPNGEVIEFTYTADENGYQAQGPYIPTPPPIPPEILKSLEFIRANPPKEQ